MPKIVKIEPPEKKLDGSEDVLDVVCVLEGEEDSIDQPFRIGEGETWEDVERQANAYHSKLVEAQEQGADVDEDVLDDWASEVCA